jgi:hypothetical protein
MNSHSRNKVRTPFLLVAVLLFFLAACAFFVAAENVDSEASAERRSLGRVQSSIAIRSVGPSTKQAPAGSGSMEILNVDRNFADQTTLQFFGRNLSASTTFKKAGFDFPRTQLWKKSVVQKNSTEYPGNAMVDDVPAEWASVWYGEAWCISDKNKPTKSSASFIIDAKGQMYGTILDGVDSYTVSSVVDEAGNWRYKHDVVSLEELPDEEWLDVVSLEELPDEEWLDESASNERREDDHIGSGHGRDLNPGLRGLNVQSSATVVNGPADSRNRQPPNPRKAILDVAVIYTETAKFMEGGDTEIHNLIGLSIFQTNMAFMNSGSNIRIRLVKTLQDRSFPDDGSLNGWNALLTEVDGYFDYWEQVKNETGADSVIVIVEHLPRWCGQSQTGGPLAIVARGCSAKAGRHSFAHELGHWFVRTLFNQLLFCLLLHLPMLNFSFYMSLKTEGWP